MKPLMLITGPVATRSGYGSHSRDLCRSLIAMDKFEILNLFNYGIEKDFPSSTGITIVRKK